MLDGGENGSAQRPREGNWDKESFRIKVVFARLVDDAQLPVTGSLPIRQDLVDLAPLQRDLVALVSQTEYQLPSQSRHINQDNA